MFEDEISELAATGLLRECEPLLNAEGVLNFSSNDYLNLSKHPNVICAAQSACDSYGTGARASRLVSGTLPCHEELELELARFLKRESAMVFGTGYLANIGLLSTLAGRNDTIVIDRLAHASLVDGAVLSRARLIRFRHNDLDHLQACLEKSANGRKSGQRTLVVTESVFSMDGDLAPLADIVGLCGEFDADLVIDEAHALGVFGLNGEGCAPAATDGLQIYITATLSKSLGSFGGVVACSESAKRFFVNRARPFIFSTALPPASVEAAREAIRIIQETRSLGSDLLEMARCFRQALEAHGISPATSNSQIVPVLISGNHRVLEVSKKLRGHGIIVPAIRKPTVPDGTERLRFSLSLGLSAENTYSTAAKLSRVL